MSDELNQDETESIEDEALANWLARLGGLLIILGTVFSMILQAWQAEAAMGAALLGFVLVLVRRVKTDV